MFAQVSVPLPRPGQASGPPPTDAAPGSPAVSVPLPGQPQQPVEPALPAIPMGRYGRPDINPYDHDINLTVPLTYQNRPLGELPVLLTYDDRFIIETEPFLRLIGVLLNDKAKGQLAAALGTKKSFSSDDLKATGISLDYDPSALAVVVLRVAPEQRLMESLFASSMRDAEAVDIQPANVSGYLNLDVVENKFWSGNQRGFQKPGFYATGAARIGPVVLEADLQLASEFDVSSDDYRFDRNYVRLVYDQPDEYRRWFLGDLTPEIRGQQNYAQMGGIGVSRQRQRFDQFRTASLQGDRQIVLQRAATVDVYRNGSLIKQFHLQPGSYDLSQLPLTIGSNNLQVQVHDDAGGVQTLNYRSYLDPIDLEPGDYEYAAYLGKVSDRIGQTPHYNGGVAFSGFYRKAFLNAPALGVGLQASRRVQVVTGQTQYVLGNGARVQLDGGVSNTRHNGAGYSTGVGYEQIFDRNGLVDSLTLQTTYLSRRFGGLSTEDPDNSSALSIDAEYARALNHELTLLFSGNYLKNRGNFGNSYRFQLSSSYQFTPKWSIRGGVTYTHYGSISSLHNGLGAIVSLVFQPGYRDRAEARYDGSTDTQTLSYTHSSDDRIGSVGYGGIVGRDSGSTQAQIFANYTGNRFDASVSHSASGTGLDHFVDQQITTVRVGTTLAFADGTFGVGRRVNDSFAVLFPNQNLRGHPVVAGQSLSQNDYMGESGPLGGALNSYLTSYVTQSIQYDVKDPPPGYDIGSGVVRVRPAYRSGYKIRVGGDAFASAVGTLLQKDGKPVSLAGGRVIALDGKDKTPGVFFTNSVGRFAVQDLRPGVHYRVELFNPAQSFEFSVPKDTTGLVDLKTLTLPSGS